MTVQRDGLDAGLTAILDDQFVRPFYLVEVLFSGAPQYFSSGPEATYGGHLYLEGRVSLSGLSWTADGDQQCTLTILNEDNDATTLALTMPITDTPVVVYQAYMDADDALIVPEVILSGVLDGCNLTPSGAEFGVVSSATGVEFVPNRFFGPATGFNHLPPAGKSIFWSGEKYVLRAED